ncbi:MAG: hypothetical protein Kilf2KO_11430 [Rhodospirillales bacterium]
MHDGRVAVVCLHCGYGNERGPDEGGGGDQMLVHGLSPEHWQLGLLTRRNNLASFDVILQELGRARKPGKPIGCGLFAPQCSNLGI